MHDLGHFVRWYIRAKKGLDGRTKHKQIVSVSLNQKLTLIQNRHHFKLSFGPQPFKLHKPRLSLGL